MGARRGHGVAGPGCFGGRKETQKETPSTLCSCQPGPAGSRRPVRTTKTADWGTAGLTCGPRERAPVSRETGDAAPQELQAP